MGIIMTGDISLIKIQAKYERLTSEVSKILNNQNLDITIFHKILCRAG